MQRKIILAFVFLCCLFGAGSTQELLCDPSTYTNNGSVPMPVLPNQFSTEIEAIILHLNFSLHVTEYYDNVNDRARIETNSILGSNVTIVDYRTLEVSHIQTAAGGDPSCAAANLSANSSRFARAVFGAQIDTNGTAHIKSTADFFMFGAGFKQRYVGVDTARGIPCHHWQSCNVSDDMRTQYTIDYYFTMSNWSYNPAMVPVQVIVRGIRPNNLTSNATHMVHNVYSFINFIPAPPADDLFRVPPGLPCVGRASGGKPLPALPQDYYSVLYEVANAVSKSVSYIREYYGLSQQLYRLDLEQTENATEIIYDLNEGVEYIVNSRFGSCVVAPLRASNNTNYYILPDGTFHLQTIRNHFLSSNEYTYTYEGVSNVREVDTESWISIRDFEALSPSNLTDGYIQVYYTTPQWAINSAVSNNNNMAVLWRVVLSGNRSYFDVNGTVQFADLNSVYDVLEFTTSEPVDDVFDVSVCFGPDQYTLLLLNFTLPEGVNYTSLDHSQLRSAIRVVFSRTANIPASRIGAIHIYERTYNSLITILRILDTPPHSIHNNTLPREQIVSILMTAVNEGKALITLGNLTLSPTLRVMRPNNETCVQPTTSQTGTMPTQPRTTTSQPTIIPVQPTIIPVQSEAMTGQSSTASQTGSTSTMVMQPQPSSSPCVVTSCAKKSGLTFGGEVGLAVGMLVVGILVGIAIGSVFCCMAGQTKKGRSYAMTYKKQKDEAVLS